MKNHGEVRLPKKVHCHHSTHSSQDAIMEVTIRQFHDGILARVQDSGEASEPFPVTNGVKQGCVFALTMFSLMFSAMLTDAFNDSDAGIGIRYRYDGSLFNLGWLQAKTKVSTETINDFLLADDCAPNAASEADMQHSVDKFCRVLQIRVNNQHQADPTSL